MTLVIIGLFILITFYLILSYNNLIKNKNLVEEGWSSIDVQLKRRSNLIPNIVNAVKGYMKHEKQLFEEITELRAKSDSANSVTDQSKGNVVAISSDFYNTPNQVTYVQIFDDKNRSLK